VSDAIQEGRRLLQEATERPWDRCRDDDGAVSIGTGGNLGEVIAWMREGLDADSSLILWAVNNAEALLDVAEAVQRMIPDAHHELWDEDGIACDPAHDGLCSRILEVERALARLKAPHE
jgi:hypothetical protein